MLLKFPPLKFVVLFTLLILLFCSGAQAKQKTVTYSLPPIDGSPHSQDIPITVSKTGSIVITVSLAYIGLPPEKMLLASLYQKGQRYVLTSKYYNTRSRNLRFVHEVDSKELARGGDYFLTLTNYSSDRVANGEVKIDYPIAGEKVHRPGEGPLPNLVVSDIRLDERCRALVTVKNDGAGELPTYFWKKNMPVLKLFKNGDLWGEVDIRFFDYQKKLNPVGGEAVYNTGLKVIDSAKIMAQIETNSRMFEEDKTDNRKEVGVVCE